MEIEQENSNPPIFNIAPVIVVLAASFIIIHAIRIWVIPTQNITDFVLLFAAIPARYGDVGGLIPYAFAAWYTPVTHAFLHGDWTHLLINTIWMTAFGSPVAFRLGTGKFLLFAAIGAICGFLFHLAFHLNDFTPMVGASGAVSAFMGAAIRLQRDISRPIMPLAASFQNRSFLAFIGVWFAMNLFFGLQPQLVVGEEAQIAWQAHIGGFLAGLFLFKAIDAK